MTFQSKEVPAWALQVALVVENLPASVGYSIDAGLIPGLGRSPGGGKRQPTPVFLPEKFHREEEPGRLQFMGSQRAGHDWATQHRHTRWYLAQRGKLASHGSGETGEIQKCTVFAGIIWFWILLCAPSLHTRYNLALGMKLYCYQAGAVIQVWK